MTLTTLVVWNSGRAAVRSQELRSENPLRFSFGEGAVVLQQRILGKSRDDFAVELALTAANELVLGIQYLNPGDGVSLEVWHTGDAVAPGPKGVVEGLMSPMTNFGLIEPLAATRPFGFQFAALTLFGFTGVLLFLVDWSSIRFVPGVQPWLGSFAVSVYLLSLMIPYGISLVHQFRTLRRQPPHKLRFAAQYLGSATNWLLLQSLERR